MSGHSITIDDDGRIYVGPPSDPGEPQRAVRLNAWCHQDIDPDEAAAALRGALAPTVPDGWVEIECPPCDGSGDCPHCGGEDGCLGCRYGRTCLVCEGRGVVHVPPGDVPPPDTTPPEVRVVDNHLHINGACDPADRFDLVLCAPLGWDEERALRAVDVALRGPLPSRGEPRRGDPWARLRSTVRAYRLLRDTPSVLTYADRVAAAADDLDRAERPPTH